jgi:hypothetical protein
MAAAGGGLTTRQISALLKEHGSYDAAIKARPDLADDLRAVQQLAEHWSRQLKPVADAARMAATVSMPRGLFAKPPKPNPYRAMADARFERDVRVYETALDRHARWQMKRANNQLEILCECGAPGYNTMLTLAIGEYDEAHGQPDRFIVAVEHEDPQMEQVVIRRDHYLVVDKFGEAERIAVTEEQRRGI